jgi:hypothetical protein
MQPAHQRAVGQELAPEPFPSLFRNAFADIPFEQPRTSQEAVDVRRLLAFRRWSALKGFFWEFERILVRAYPFA